MLKIAIKSTAKFYFFLVTAVLWVVILVTLIVLKNIPPKIENDDTLNSFLLVQENTHKFEPITPIPNVTNLDSQKVALGFKLFSDPKLSHDNMVSCASCHDLRHGGVDNLPVSFGINGTKTTRNSPTVFNTAFSFKQFWDGRILTLEEQAAAPLLNPNEMGSSWNEILKKLSASSDYKKAFNDIYAENHITAKQVVDAIATFERSLTTPNSPFDKWLKGDAKALSDKQKEGYKLFKSYGCISCHHGVNVGGNMFEQLGVFSDFFVEHPKSGQDLGRFNITHDESQKHEFKVPSLRNIALTAPYLHDGSVKELHEMISIMATHQLGVTLSESEIDAIEAFLNSLTGDIPKGIQ